MKRDWNEILREQGDVSKEFMMELETLANKHVPKLGLLGVLGAIEIFKGLINYPLEEE